MKNNTINLCSFEELHKTLNHIFYNLKKFKFILNLEANFLSTTPVNYLKIQFIIEKKQKIVNKLNELDKKRISLEKTLNIRSNDLKHPKSQNLWKKIQSITHEVYERNEKNNQKISTQMNFVNTLQKKFTQVIPEATFYRSDGNSYKLLTKNFQSKA
ncbi:FlgN family flagellar biosynthesis protein [Wigglesworthia glossinidia endosymbiont of Glossina morsitans morsitans (Yale colony)]|uniref:FlgN family flagellar biosynthesis protein n=1 Tax=Wigglesworthia glossinidia endosymbiont of Glossina morsitans morsitans (Yale colony) TaxID=1142511 RepID=H6Q4B7_WIGGL|nr:flagellar protein FlgN [Wigglesworthia glossinidia]AFA40900.1 FlgN family flagellar biosynthesis protein [Wigglesworthia glossinidia endosymbiont of Glossina morsitans morsitans (Yale colony)]